MTQNFDNETWLLELGDKVVSKKALAGVQCLTTWERLVYALWVADYGMRNAGDLHTAKDLCADFQTMALSAARELSLETAGTLFSLEQSAIEAAYFDRFDEVCDEVRTANPSE